MDEQSEPKRSNAPPLGFTSSEALAHSKLVATALLALSVGCVFAMLSGPPIISVAARWAMECFAFAVPTISLHLFSLSAAAHRPYAVGCIVRLVTTCGMIAAIAGFGCAVWSLQPSAGIIFVIAAPICLGLAQRAESRGKELRAIAETDPAERR